MFSFLFEMKKIIKIIFKIYLDIFYLINRHLLQLIKNYKFSVCGFIPHKEALNYNE